jgi:hypothetical protein
VSVLPHFFNVACLLQRCSSHCRMMTMLRSVIALLELCIALLHFNAKLLRR